MSPCCCCCCRCRCRCRELSALDDVGEARGVDLEVVETFDVDLLVLHRGVSLDGAGGGGGGANTPWLLLPALASA